MSDSLRPHRLRHARLPCSSLSPWVCLNSCSLCHWCHPTISFSVTPFSSCVQSFPASGSFLSQLIATGGQSTGISVSAPVLPMNIQGWSPLGQTMVWSPCSPMDSQESFLTPQFESINSSAVNFLFGPTLRSVCDYWKYKSSSNYYFIVIL